MPRVVLFSLILLVGGLSLSAAPGKPWLYAESEHFQMLSATSEKKSQQLLADFEEFHQLLQIFYGSPRLAEKRTTIVVFEYDEDFEPYKPKAANGKVRNVAAYYLGGLDEAYIAMVAGPAAGRDVKEIVYHEYVHQFFDMMDYDLPLWLNEGLAEVLSTLRVKKNRLEFGQYKEASLHYLSSYGIIKVSPLSWLFSVEKTSEAYHHGSMQARFYAQSWLLVHYWLCNPEYTEKYLRFLELWEHSDLEMLEIMETAFGMNDEQMQAALIDYVKRGKFLVQRIPLKSKPTRIRPEFRRANQFEIDVGLENLWARALHPADAEIRFIELADRYPESARPLETLAVLAGIRGDSEAVKRYFKEAIDRGTKNSHVHVAYAQMELDRIDVKSSLDYRLPTDLAEALRSSLRLAIESNPNHTKSIELLAYLESVAAKPNISNVKLVESRVRDMRDSRGTLLSLAVIRWKYQDYQTVDHILAALKRKKPMGWSGKRRLAILEERFNALKAADSD